ncbi:UNVERIFIED_CONTAM: hypothetical protein FKN15_045974 [Acipenser sinensis]
MTAPNALCRMDFLVNNPTTILKEIGYERTGAMYRHWLLGHMQLSAGKSQLCFVYKEWQLGIGCLRIHDWQLSAGKSQLCFVYKEWQLGIGRLRIRDWQVGVSCWSSRYKREPGLMSQDCLTNNSPRDSEDACVQV